MSKVFIGVGHGGSDPGAVANGLREADINLQMALELQRQLERHGVQTCISRTKDENDPLSEEISEANRYRPDLAVDVHNNAGGGDGFEAFVQTNVYQGKSRAAAQDIEAAVIAMGQNSRGIKTKLNSSKTDWFGFLREIDAPAILVEGAFVDNKNDAAQMDELHEQKAFGTAYAKGILKYLGICWQDSGETEDGAPETSEKLTRIMAQSIAAAAQLVGFCKNNSAKPKLPHCTIEELADMFLEEGKLEGVRGDVAFAQSILETGFFQFGGIVTPYMNNYAGIGALNGNSSGSAASFPTPREGVRAQIQHLKAYASTDHLMSSCVDPRFHLVARGSAPYTEWLGAADNPQGKGWAVPGKGYGVSVVELLAKIIATQTSPNPGQPPTENADDFLKWQTDGFEVLVKAGVITDPDYWKGRFSQTATIGELMGVLGAILS